MSAQRVELKSNNTKVILGIDPGTVVMGYGLLKAEKGKFELLSMGVVRLNKFPDHNEKLKRIYERVQGLIIEYKPDMVAIEAPFFGKNVQSMLKLGRAQGVAIAAAMNNGLTVTEYSPKKVKQSISGNGNASKEQVALLLQRMFNIEQVPSFLDATDALAVAVCHYNQSKTVGAQASHSRGSWESFIKNNPGRVK